jgi:hypothetical protein
MATTDAVNGWDQRVLAVVEATFGTTPNPAGSQALEVIDLDMGPVEQGDVRPKKDKTEGRDETLAFVEGRIQPIPFSLTTSVKSRAANTTVPKESPLYKAAGLQETVGGSSVAYTFNSAPSIIGLSLYRAFGATPVEAEQGRGGVVKSLSWEFGDKELMVKAAGAFIGKYHLGSTDAATVANNSNTSVSMTSGEGYRIGLGWYLWESEIIKVTAVSTDTLTIARAALSSSAAAHSAAALTPYIPSLTLAGSPISEANCTVTLDGVATRCIKGSLELTTGIEHLPGETGSAYVQGAKVMRFKIKGSLDLVLTRQFTDLLGKTTRRKSMALTIVCGTGTGGIVTFTLPTIEARAFPVPGPADDISVITIPIAVAGSTGNDSMTVTLT